MNARCFAADAITPAESRCSFIRAAFGGANMRSRCLSISARLASYGACGSQDYPVFVRINPLYFGFETGVKSTYHADAGPRLSRQTDASQEYIQNETTPKSLGDNSS